MEWLLWFGGGAVAVTAVAGVLRGSWRIVRIVVKVEAALPTLIAMADEFKPNSGNSLRDRIDMLDTRTASVESLVRAAHPELTGRG